MGTVCLCTPDKMLRKANHTKDIKKTKRMNIDPMILKSHINGAELNRQLSATSESELYIDNRFSSECINNDTKLNARVLGTYKLVLQTSSSIVTDSCTLNKIPLLTLRASTTSTSAIIVTEDDELFSKKRE